MQRRKGPNVSRGSSDALTQGGRRSPEKGRSQQGDFGDDDYDDQESHGIASGSDRPTSSQHSRRTGDRQAYDDADGASGDGAGSSKLRLTLMEEVLLLGLKDKQVRLPVAFRKEIFLASKRDERTVP
jgi:hypothetical protein